MHLASMNVCDESFLEDTASPPKPRGYSSVYIKDVQLFKNKEVDGIKMHAACLSDRPKIAEPYAISFSPPDPSVHHEGRGKRLSQKKANELHNDSVHSTGL